MLLQINGPTEQIGFWVVDEQTISWDDNICILIPKKCNEREL